MNAHLPCLALALALLPAGAARADAVTDWNQKAGEIVVAAGLATPPANRVMALTHTAAFEAAQAAAQRLPSAPASMEAAIAAAHRHTLAALLPLEQAAVDSAYRNAMARIADGAARDAGLAVGEAAARALLARRAKDGADAAEDYRPFTQPGRYVPTAIPVAPQWPQRQPWLMSSPSQFRPGPPPALDSARWARDYNEIRSLGRRDSPQRSAEQGAIARFWETTAPPIYHGVVRSVAGQPGRELLRNARLFMAVTQGIDDAMIAVFDAKYHHAFWRPITAIRNGDIDGNDATPRDPSWTPLIATPMHPEYPCAHCIQAGVVGSILRAELARAAPVALATTSATADGRERRWPGVDAFMHEVADARVWGGVHYRFSTEAGLEMGQRIGTLAVQRWLAD